MVADNKNVVRENEALKKEFVRLGLEITDVWCPTPDNLALENRRLNGIRDWVRAYKTCPDRRRLQKKGYYYPPVDPDTDPDSDWIMFERWVQGRALAWKYADEFDDLVEPELMTDIRLAVEFDRVIERLKGRGVVVDLQCDVPARAAYTYLYKELRDTPFEFMGPNTNLHLTGCTGYCPDCFQRQWCETGSEPWPEDE